VSRQTYQSVDAPSGVAAVYRWRDGTVSTFDRKGDEVPGLQGRLTPELEARIVAAADLDTEWFGFAIVPLDWMGD
jgi:hypothetical protein